MATTGVKISKALLILPNLRCIGVYIFLFRRRLFTPEALPLGRVKKLSKHGTENILVIK